MHRVHDSPCRPFARSQAAFAIQIPTVDTASRGAPQHVFMQATLVLVQLAQKGDGLITLMLHRQLLEPVQQPWPRLAECSLLLSRQIYHAVLSLCMSA